MPLEIVYAFAHLKRAAAITNCECGILSEETRERIIEHINEIVKDTDEHKQILERFKDIYREYKKNV